MEQELSSWIENGRAKGACISGFVIRVKALEIMREHCRRDDRPLIFKASVGWLLNFLKRNKWVLRRITTSGRDLPDNSIETILNFLVEMKQHFIDGKIDFDWIVNMDETSIYLDFPSNYTYEKKVLF